MGEIIWDIHGEKTYEPSPTKSSSTFLLDVFWGKVVADMVLDWA